MTPEEEFRLLRETSKDIEGAVQKAFDELLRLIREGADPRDATQTVMASFTGEYAAIYAAGLGVVMSESIGTTSALQSATGRVTLSQRLYAQADATSQRVTNVIDNHRRGFQDSRTLALQLFEGYDFRDEEIINIAKGNKELPRYMREALLIDPRLEDKFKRAFAKIQVSDLRTPELRAAYRQLLESIDSIEAGEGAKALNKKLKVAFYERMRYFAKRIAETELHRNYAIQEAKNIMADDDIEFVQWRLSPAHPVEDICDYFAGVDRYGLGPGVYPKELAPVAPAHPFCKCVLSPRLDLNGKEIKPVQDSESRFFRQYSDDEQRKIAGSLDKLDQIRKGGNAWDVHNAKIDDLYKVKEAGKV
jgi:hypothetical protein